jgi:hypothetical protein
MERSCGSMTSVLKGAWVATLLTLAPSPPVCADTGVAPGQ